MITYEQALVANEFHDETIACGQRNRSNLWRRNGATKTWKTRPGQFRIPIKWGLRGYGYIDNSNAYQFHIIAECSIDPLKGNSFDPRQFPQDKVVS